MSRTRTPDKRKASPQLSVVPAHARAARIREPLRSGVVTPRRAVRSRPKADASAKHPCQQRATARGRALRRAYRLMRVHFGHQHWWPGETPFEVCVGAILTQSTSWSNVERAIANLKAARLLKPRELYSLEESQLAAFLQLSRGLLGRLQRQRSSEEPGSCFQSCIQQLPIQGHRCHNQDLLDRRYLEP